MITKSESPSSRKETMSLSKMSPERTLHKDLLLPCGFLAFSIQDEIRQEKEKRGKAPTHQASEMPQEAVESEQPWENEEEVDYCYPQTAKEDAIFWTVTIVHEIPHLRVDLSGGNDKDKLSSEELGLNPEADVFHPKRDLGDSTLENEGDSPVERNSPVEINLPVEIDLPVEDDPGVESESVKDESVKGNTTETSEGNVEEGKDDSKTHLITEEESRVEEKGGDELRVSEDDPESITPEEMKGSEVTRLTRQRVEPERLPYKSLRNPLAFVMHSIVNGLDQVVTQALDFTSTPEIGQVLHV